MADHPRRIRQRSSSRIGPRLAAACALLLGGCISADRAPSRVAADAEVGSDGADTAVADSAVAESEGVDTPSAELGDAPEADVPNSDGSDGGCASADACPGPDHGNPCVEAACIDGACGYANVGNGAPCDDGDPCRTGDYCDAGTCIGGNTIAAGTTTCSDGDECNGLEHCAEGSCVPAQAPTCTADGPILVCSAHHCVPKGMLLIPEGTFQMGCDSPPEANCPTGSTPRITVYLSAYAIDRTEASELDFQACVAAKLCAPRDQQRGPSDPGRPAASLTFQQAQDLCAFGGKRLCRETEWERAARGGADTRRYPWGDTPAPDCDRANFTKAGSTCSDDQRFDTVAVDSGAAGASREGAVNMLGNVREWVFDRFDPDTYQRWHAAAGANGTVINPPAPDKTSGGPVVRGLGFRQQASELRVDYRGAETADTYADDLGVRCCVDLPVPTTTVAPP